MCFLLLCFIMLYTEDFSMCHYVGFSQIGSHLLFLCKQEKYKVEPVTILRHITGQAEMVWLLWSSPDHFLQGKSKLIFGSYN